MRGFFGIGAYAPTKGVNVGTLLRHAHSFGASFTFTVGGNRRAIEQGNTTKSMRHIPHYHFDSWAETKLPMDCRLVAIEITDGATPLPKFKHPERAAYLVGPENGSLPKHVLEAAKDVVMIPGGQFCLNLSVAGTLVLYDRVTRP